MDEDGDVFFDQFEDEAEILCYNEVQKTAEMFEGANQIFINDANGIETQERGADYLTQASPSRADVVVGEIELSLYIHCSYVTIFIYSRNDANTGCSVSINDMKFQKENDDISLKLDKIDVLLKQNAMLISQDFMDCYDELRKLLKIQGSKPEDQSTYQNTKSIFEKYPLLKDRTITITIDKGIDFYVSEYFQSRIRPSALMTLEADTVYTSST